MLTSLLISILTASAEIPKEQQEVPISNFPKGKTISFKKDLIYKIGQKRLFLDLKEEGDDCIVEVEIRSGDLANNPNISANTNLTVKSVEQYSIKEPGTIPAGKAFTYYMIFEGGEVWNITEMTGLEVEEDGFTYLISALHKADKYWTFAIRHDDRFYQDTTSYHKGRRGQTIELTGSTNAVFYRNPDNSIECLQKHINVH